MRLLSTLLLLATGCHLMQPLPEELPTKAVASSPFGETTRVATKIDCPPASAEAAIRVELLRGQLIGKNPQVGLNPRVVTLGSPTAEIFHVDADHVYITEALVRRCPEDGNLAAVLAYEFGRIVSEREATVSDEVRRPERLRPIALRIGSNGYADDADPFYQTELARHERKYPRHQRKLARPNPQAVARAMLEEAGFQRGELDAVLPLLAEAERSPLLESQFKGTLRQGDWQRP